MFVLFNHWSNLNHSHNLVQINMNRVQQLSVEEYRTLLLIIMSFLSSFSFVSSPTGLSIWACEISNVLKNEVTPERDNGNIGAKISFELSNLCNAKTKVIQIMIYILRVFVYITRKPDINDWSTLTEALLPVKTSLHQPKKYPSIIVTNDVAKVTHGDHQSIVRRDMLAIWRQKFKRIKTYINWRSRSV